MSAGEYQIIINGFSDRGVAADKLVWQDPDAGKLQLRKDIKKWLYRKFCITMPNTAHLSVNHGDMTITLTVTEQKKTKRRVVRSVDSGLLASLM